MKTAIQIFLKQTQRGTKRLALQLVLLCAAAAATLLLSLTACGEKQPEHTHKWEPANCNRGEFCFSCGETKGKALGHSWVDATCDKAKHCTLCGKSEGNTLEHISDGNGVCTVCKQALDQVARLHLSNTEKECTVYDGVIVQLPFGGMPGEYGYLKDYEIYDQNGILVAQGEFPLSVPIYEYDENGEKQFRNCLKSDFIPLPQGEYQILYHAYEMSMEIHTDEDGNDLPWEPDFTKTDERYNANRCYKRPAGDLVAGSVSLIVK